MRTSIFLDYDGDPIALAGQVVDAESAGIDDVWVAEAYGFDAVSLLGYLAAKTSTIRLASGILPLGTRTPALLGMTAAGIDALSGGRFTLGLGSSGPQVIEGLHGVAFDRPLARTRDTIEICRILWRRDPVEYQGATVTLPNPGGRPMRLITTPVRAQIPIAIAAMGPKNVELTAELADAWLPMFGFFHPEKWHDVWGASLAAGLAKRAPELAPLDVVVGGEVCIGPDGESVRDRSKALVALYVGGMGSREQNFYNDLFRRYGYEDEAATIQDRFLGRDRDGAAAAVPDEFIEATSLCGDEDFVRAQVVRYRDAGATNLLVRPIGPDKIGTLHSLREIVADLS